jgi:hypothetical protein
MQNGRIDLDQQQQSAQSVKNLLADLNVMEPGVKNLLGL